MDGADLELFEMWKSGDAQAGQELVRRHFDGVYRFVRNKVSEGAEDLAQQAFLACVEGRHRFRGEGSFRAFVFGAAKNLVYHHWEKQARGREVPLPELSIYDLAPSPASGLARRQDERLLVRALRRIPLEFQIAIELYYMEGLKSREVAEILEIPHATVRSRLRRGLEQVKRWVEELGDSGDQVTTTMSRIEQWAAAVRT